MSFVPTSAGFNAISDIGTAVSGVGKIISGQNAVAMGNYNAQISMQQATAQQKSFDLQMQEEKITASQEVAQEQASYAKSGVAFKGTPVDMMVESLTNINLDEAIQTYNNNIKVQGLQQQAALDRYTASQTATVDYTSGGLSLLASGLDLSKEIGSPSNTNYTFSPSDFGTKLVTGA